MKRFVRMVLIAALIQILWIAMLNIGNAFSASPSKVDKKKVEVKVQFEQVVSGPLTPLNGKYKLRLTETVFEPGGYMGEHQHGGPGIRFIESGAITSGYPEKTVIHSAGDHFYESGSTVHRLQNKTDAPVRVLNVELLPVDWKGPSAVPLQSTQGTPQAALTFPTPAHSPKHP